MKFFLLLISFVLVGTSFGQAGLPDSTFNQSRIKNFSKGTGSDGIIRVVKVQPNGKILLGGNFATYNGDYTGNLIRLNPDGSRDKTFQANIPNSMVDQINILTNGNILISGSFNQVNGNAINGIVLLDSTGQISTIFNSGTGIHSNISSSFSVQSTVIQPDQKIIVTGNFTSYNGTSCNGIVRLLPNGTIDPGFNRDGVDNYIYSILIQPDGKLIVSGYFSNCQGNPAFGICRLTSNGDFDPTFQAGSSISTSAFIFDIEFQSSGKILACGDFTHFNGQSFGGLMRLNSDGSIDNTFTSGSSTFPYRRYTLKVLPDDSFFMTGNFNNYTLSTPSQFIVKITADGAIDPSFAIGSPFDENTQSQNTRHINSIEILSSGKLLCAGEFNEYNGVKVKDLICIDQNAQLDYDFLPFTGCNDVVLCTAVDLNNRILVGGTFSMFDNKIRGRFVRLLEDGTLDPNFDTGIGADDEVKAIAVQADGKIILAGKFNHFNGISRNCIVRLNDDGSVDQSYNPGAAFITVNGNINWVNVIKLQADGSLLAVGKLAYANPDLRRQVIRFNPNGSLDYSFHPPFDEPIEAELLEIQSTNKILVAGRNSMGITRLNYDGTLDTLVSTYRAYSLCVDEQDNIYSSAFYPPYDVGLLKKYNPNGVLMIEGQAAGGLMTMLPNGKIQAGLRRFNSDLTIDNTFEAQMFNNNLFFYEPYITTLSFQQHGQIIIGGKFDQYGTVFANNICRITNDISYIPFLKLTFQSVDDISCSSPGQAKAVGYAGTPPYSYLWNTTPPITDSLATFNTPGIYSCTVSDYYGDVKTASILINGNPQNGFDLRFSSIPTEFRPGFNAHYTIDAFNDGCVPVSGQLILTFDNSLLSYVSSNPAPISMTGNTLTWNFQNWTADSAHFTPHITFLTSTAAQIGDSVFFQTEINPSQNDFDPSNNYMTSKFPIVNGFDPNDKAVDPKGKCDEGYILPDQKLTYRIRFQNTGNSEAINISVIDQLSPNLDIRTVKVIAKSHDCWTEVQDNNTLNFHFDEIHLIDSNANEELSHGYIIFEVDPIHPIANNASIDNHAEIYFDYNPAVITNMVSNRIYNSQDVDLNDYECNPDEANELTETSIYPNPSTGNVTILFTPDDKTKSVSLIDNQGRLVLSYTNIESDSLLLDLMNFPSGTYLLKVNYSDKTEIKRILKTL